MKKLKTGIAAGLATIAGREKTCAQVVASLIDQFDHVYVYRNSGTYLQNHPKLTILTGTNLGDVGKFVGLELTQFTHYASCDDDILYPAGYAENLISQPDAITTHHGRYFNEFPITGYYRGYSKVFMCLQPNLVKAQVHFPGTGVSCYDITRFKPDWKSYTHINMSDVFVGIQAHKENLPIFVLPHNKGYFQDISPDSGIWAANYRNDKIHVELINQVFCGKT